MSFARCPRCGLIPGFVQRIGDDELVCLNCGLPEDAVADVIDLRQHQAERLLVGMAGDVEQRWHIARAAYPTELEAAREFAAEMLAQALVEGEDKTLLTIQALRERQHGVRRADG